MPRFSHGGLFGGERPTDPPSPIRQTDDAVTSSTPVVHDASYHGSEEGHRPLLQTDSLPFVPPRFETMVAGHLALNAVVSARDPAPLILAVHGPHGEGKTRQCEWTFERMGVCWQVPESNAFEDPNTGKVAGRIEADYRTAARANALAQEQGRAELRVLFINDLELWIGRRDGLVQQTTNTQHVLAKLQQIADNPEADPTLPGSRAPIVVTSNDLGVVHPPLLRDGRATRFEWRPTQAERIATIQAMFPALALEQSHVRDLLALVPDPPQPSSERTLRGSIATFAAARAVIRQRHIEALLAQIGISRIVEYIRTGRVTYSDIEPTFTYETLMEVVANLAATAELRDHLS
jgi:hypothetical protein